MQAMRFNVAGLALAHWGQVVDQVARVLQQRLGAGSFVAGERVPSGFEVADLRERLLVVRFVLSPAV